MQNHNRILVLPVQTYHNVRAPLSKYNLEIDKAVTLIDRYFVNVSSTSWMKMMIDKVVSEIPLNSEVHLVLIGHPLINVMAVQALLGYGVSKLYLYGWDAKHRRYTRILLDKDGRVLAHE